LTSDVRKLLDLPPAVNTDELLKRVPGKWKKVKDRYHLEGPDLKEAITSFFLK
jgi:hypothetical protein